MESLTSIIEENEEDEMCIDKEYLFKEFLRLRCTDSKREMRDLVDAYLKWYNKGKEPADRRGDILEMFDFLAGVFDKYSVRNVFDSELLEMENLTQAYNVGPIKRFFRNALNYHPENNAMNKQAKSFEYSPYEINHVKIIDELCERTN